jgi:hypothetical protein
MSVVFPKEKIARRWRGALQASLRRAPLEAFLRFRALKVASRGPARDTDNICRATIFILHSPLATFAEPPDAAQRAIVGQLACSICDTLARLIEEPGASRVAALVSAAKLMPRAQGLVASGSRAATAAPGHGSQSPMSMAESQWMGQIAAQAVVHNSDVFLQQFSAHAVALLGAADRIAMAMPEYDASLCSGATFR